MKQKLYLLMLFCLAIAVATAFLGPSISTWMASDAPLPEQQQRLYLLYQQLIFSPLSQPIQPIPSLLTRYAPIFIIVILSWLQVILLVRRVLICMNAREVIAPPHLNIAWKIILSIGLFSWVLTVAIILLPRIIRPFFGGDFAFGAGVVQAFILPFILIPSSNLLGIVFFLLESSSVVKEGFLPSPNQSIEQTRRNNDDKRGKGVKSSNM